MSDTLVLFTSQFPYGKSETFLENEITYLAGAFNKVYIIVLNKTDSIREVPANVMVLDIGEAFNKSYTLSKSLTYLNLPTLSAFVKEYRKVKSRKVGSQHEFVSYMLRINYKAFLLESLLNRYNIPKNAILYSYWFEEWATILSILKLKGLINSFHARTHGFDLYEERTEKGFIYFREFQLRQVATVSAVSKAGFNYLNFKHPKFSNKFFLYQLGVQDCGLGPFKKNRYLTIVSCSNVVPLKRVNLIVEILSNVNNPLRWIHFGDGPLLGNIKERASKLPNSISYEFKGRIDNQELIQFYKNNQVDLFITTTETEGGCPVSIQEAISFGIPVIGTNVGGVSEIVNSRTGILVEEGFDIAFVAKIIENFKFSDLNTFEFRLQVRKFWKENFKAETNFKRYINDVLLSSEQRVL